MKSYETLVLFAENTTEADQKKLVDAIKVLIEKNKGNLKDTENWGKKALAFKIGQSKSGFYWLLNWEGPESQPKKINDLLRIEDSVLRFLTSSSTGVKKAKSKKIEKTVEPKKKLAETFIR